MQKYNIDYNLVIPQDRSDFMGLIDKFDNIEVRKENVIPSTDMLFCQKQFEFYFKIYKHYESHLNTMLKLEEEQDRVKEFSKIYVNYPDTYIWSYSGISSTETKKAMVKLSGSFISCICDYFKDKYSITINENFVLKSLDKYEREPRFCELNEILDKCIVGNLNGMTFLEKAIEEIRGKAKTERYYSDWRKEWNYDIKGIWAFFVHWNFRGERC